MMWLDYKYIIRKVFYSEYFSSTLD